MMNLSPDASTFDGLISALSRPSIAIACGLAVAGSCFIPASAPIAIPVAGGIVAAYMAARTIDKKTAANAAQVSGSTP